MSASKRLKALTYVDDRQRRRCLKHGKIYYSTDTKAYKALLEYLRHPQGDPGAVIYGCRYTRGWHIGHPGGWKSLARVEAEASGVKRMEKVS